MCDCTTLLSRVPARAACSTTDSAEAIASLDRLQRCVGAAGLRARAVALGVIKQLLAERDASFDPGGSASELHVLEVIRDAGLPEPVQQHAVRVGRHGRTSSTSPGRSSKVFAEYYGLAVHSGASAVAYDSDRLTALVGDGLAPARLHRRDAGSARSSTDVAERCSTATNQIGAVEHRMSA